MKESSFLPKSHIKKHTQICMFKGTVLSRSAGHGIGVLVLRLTHVTENNTPHDKVVITVATA